MHRHGKLECQLSELGNRNLSDYDKPGWREQYGISPGSEDFTENSLALGSLIEEVV